MLIVALANSKNWLWIDKNSKTLGGLAMPWNYTVNLSLFYAHKHQENEKEILYNNDLYPCGSNAHYELMLEGSPGAGFQQRRCVG